MKLADAVICWTPNRPEFPSGFRGKLRIFPAPGLADIAPFAQRAGRCDPRAHDQRLEVREVYCLQIAFVLSERDGLEAMEVHRQMLTIEEYVSACAPELFELQPH